MPAKMVAFQKKWSVMKGEMNMYIHMEVREIIYQRMHVWELNTCTLINIWAIMCYQNCVAATDSSFIALGSISKHGHKLQIFKQILALFT